MAQGAQELPQRRAGIGRRGGVLLIVVALGLGGGAAYAANTYVATEARKVTAPVRSVLVAGRDIAAGALVSPADLAAADIPVPDDLAALYEGPDRKAEGGVAVHALRHGQPILTGDLLPAATAQTVAPLVPTTVTVGGSAQRVVGALNVPIGRIQLPPPPLRVNDRVDVWMWVAPPAGSTRAAATQAVLSDIEVRSRSCSERHDAYPSQIAWAPAGTSTPYSARKRSIC